MIKNTSIILILNIFLFSGMANAEKVSANVQATANGTSSGPVSDTEDTAQQNKEGMRLEKQASSNETGSEAAKTGQGEGANPTADSAIGASEEKAAIDKARQEAAIEMDARVRAAQRKAARAMAARVRAVQREADRKMAARVKAAKEEAAKEMAARVRAAREEAAREVAARVEAAKQEAAREMAARAKERAARDKAYRARMDRYEAERRNFREDRGYSRAPF